jgi:glutamyl-tRNA synthetase/glutamyl-Q tRNA(Asp) synthetase
VSCVCRFAPAPTGRLHLGHVVNAIHVWGVTRAAGGRVLLRIEDHDRQRSRSEFDRGIIADLQWLGFHADAPAVRQSERNSIYESALARLREQGLVYGCACTRSEIAAANSGPIAVTDQDQEVRYPGTCASKGLRDGPGMGTRVRLARSTEFFDDLRHGPQEQCPAAQTGDLLAKDRDGNWTYQFAVTVDDLVQGVTLVVRGDDLLPSTGRQIQLARLLGRTAPPRFLHHGLVMKSPTQKLSKADRDTSVKDLRAGGATASQVVGEAAFRAGLIDRVREVAADEAADIVRPHFERALRSLA